MPVIRNLVHVPRGVSPYFLQLCYHPSSGSFLCTYKNLTDLWSQVEVDLSGWLLSWRLLGLGVRGEPASVSHSNSFTRAFSGVFSVWQYSGALLCSINEHRRQQGQYNIERMDVKNTFVAAFFFRLHLLVAASGSSSELCYCSLESVLRSLDP